MNNSKWFVGLPVVTVLAGGILIGCGGNNGTSSATNAVTESPLTKPEPSSEFELGPLSVPAGGSADYEIRGHREDVPTFGKEGSDTELTQAATAVHGYLVARIEKDWPAACSYVSAGLLRRLAARSKHPERARCEVILAELTVPGRGSEYEMSEVEANGLRLRGKKGFLLYSAAAAPYFMPVSEAGATWKVNSLAPTSFYFTSR